jgi:hypothetical protein
MARARKKGKAKRNKANLKKRYEVVRRNLDIIRSLTEDQEIGQVENS